MTSKLPSRKLVDILQQNSNRVLERHSAELTAVLSKMPEEVSQTRFLRNAYLISPKSLCVLPNASNTLYPWHIFAVYKPPFCPMRRMHASDNYHKVSIESFVSAAIKSTEVMPIVQKTLRPEDVHVRVLYDLDQFASGPVIVSLCDKHSFATSLRSFTMEYDVLVAGHLPKDECKEIPTELLYPQITKEKKVQQAEHKEEEKNDDVKIDNTDDEKQSNDIINTKCTYEVRRNVYYHAHMASLLNVKITSPISPLPPEINKYVRTHLNTYVLGDPHAVEFYINSNSTKNDQRYYTGGVFTRGDFDFPRVFTHLREVSINVSDEQPYVGTSVNKNSNNEMNSSQNVTFHCYRCFEPQLKTFLSTSYKVRLVNLFDGVWTPESEVD